MSLRDYQINSIALIKERFAAGDKRVMLWLATGAGKTVVFCEMIKRAQERGKKCIIVVRGTKLVDQASKRLFAEGVAHGVRQANHWNRNYGAPVQVCSIDTLIARSDYPEADVIIIDECDQATSDGYIEFASKYPDAHFVSVTATPWTDKSLSHVAQSVVHPITMQELIDQGWLCGFKYYAPSEPDLAGVKISSSTKDYVSDQLETRMSGLTGDILEHWVALGEGRPTLGFAVNVHHSKTLTEMFNSKFIKAEHCDAKTPDAQRNAIFERLSRGETKIVFNVGIATRGVDVPPVACLIMGRPTKSRNLYIQMAGRGTRLHSGKKNCIILDHAGNIMRHGLPTMEPEVEIGSTVVKSESYTMDSKVCKKCFIVYRGPSCPECGSEETRVKQIVVSDGTLEELLISDSSDPIEQYLSYLEHKRKIGRYKPGWVYYKLIDRFGHEAVAHKLPHWFRYENKFVKDSNDPFSGSRFKGINDYE